MTFLALLHVPFFQFQNKLWNAVTTKGLNLAKLKKGYKYGYVRLFGRFAIAWKEVFFFEAFECEKKHGDTDFIHPSMFWVPTKGPTKRLRGMMRGEVGRK